MPPYLTNYEHDVFVSYAHADDRPWMPDKLGWVSTLVPLLGVALGMELGRPENLSIWFDNYNLRGNSPVTQEIRNKVVNSATLLVVCSQSYLKSTWCRQELELFVERAGSNSRRTFIIDFRKVDRPPAVADLPGYRFWYRDQNNVERTYAIPCPNANEIAYFNLIQDLGRDLGGKLNELKEQSSGHLVDVPSIDSQNTVFLAEVPDSLVERREQVRRYFQQQGVRVLPERNYSFSDRQRLLDTDIEVADLFVQLLNEDDGLGVPQYQYERAKSIGRRVIQWRDPSLQPERIRSHQHRIFLEGPDVQKSSLVDFQAYALRQLRLKIAPPRPRMVFINSAPEDLDLAGRIEEVFRRESIGCILPMKVSQETGVEDVNDDLECSLLDCDAVVVLYGDVKVNWVRKQVLLCNKMIGKRQEPLNVAIVYSKPNENPNEQKQPLNISLPFLKTFEEPISEFEKRLRELFGGVGE